VINVSAEVERALGVSSPTAGVAVVWNAVCSGEPADAGVEAEIVGSSWRLSGEVSTVLWPDAGTSLLVVARSKPVAGRARGLRVYRLPLDAPGVTHVPRPLLAYVGRSVRLDGVEVSDSDSVGPPRDATPALAGAFDALCVDAVGEMLAASQAALDEAVRWVSERVQFGEPLAARQAVRHRAADMATSIAAVRALYEHARDAASRGRCTIDAAVAKLVASDRLPDVTAGAHQLHGGEGYYADRPLHQFHKQVCTLAALFGNGSHQRVRLARLLAE
jgi:alkylation response protein AidB-like acyl-CoA dehydrogenase